MIYLVAAVATTVTIGRACFIANRRVIDEKIPDPDTTASTRFGIKIQQDTLSTTKVIDCCWRTT